MWLVSLGAVLGANEPGALRHLSDDERLRASRLHFEQARVRWVASRLALRALLGAHVGMSPHALRFTLGPQGKPALAGAPSVSFNLSHSGELVVIAVAADWPLGVDVEVVVPERATLALAETVFSAAELAAFVALPAPERPAAFFRGWTRKEAVVKATGEGLCADLRAFDVSLGAEEPPRLHALREGVASGPYPRDGASWTLRDLPVDRGYQAAIALPTAPVHLHVYGAERTLVETRGEHLQARW